MLALNKKQVDNSLYIQLQKDLKKKKNKNRIYIPVVVLQEDRDNTHKPTPSIGKKISFLINTIIK